MVEQLNPSRWKEIDIKVKTAAIATGMNILLTGMKFLLYFFSGSMAILAEAYGKDKEFFEFIKSMEVYKDILSQKSTLILSTDSDLFRYLNNPQGQRR